MAFRGDRSGSRPNRVLRLPNPVNNPMIPALARRNVA
jgi:hypothetical protein